jgi:hypothetical protein
VVNGEWSNSNYWRSIEFRININRNVFNIKIVLGIKNIICLWIYDYGVNNYNDSECVSKYSMKVINDKWRRIKMEMEKIYGRRLEIWICINVIIIIFII